MKNHRPIAAKATFLTVLLSAALASAQPLNGGSARDSVRDAYARHAPTITLVTSHGVLEVRPGIRTASFRPASEDVRISRSLLPPEANELQTAYRIAADCKRSAPSEVQVRTPGVDQPVYLDPDNGLVTPLIDRLHDLRASLVENPIRARSATLKTWSKAPGAIVTLELDDVVRKLSLSYTLGQQTWELPTPGTTGLERTAIRRLFDYFPGNGDEETRAANTGDEGGLQLEIKGSTRSFGYHATHAGALAPSVVDLGRGLQRLMRRVFAYSQRTLTGRVERGVILCDGFVLRAQEPLTALLAELEGQQIVVQALVRLDGTWGTALYLLAHDDADGILPIESLGHRPGTLLATHDFVKPDIPHGKNLQTLTRLWSTDDVSLDWDPTRAVAFVSAVSNESGDEEPLRRSNGLLYRLR